MQLLLKHSGVVAVLQPAAELKPSLWRGYRAPERDTGVPAVRAVDYGG